MNSGVYGWHGDDRLHQVYKFDSRGAPVPHAYVTTVSPKSVRTQIEFGEHESAVLVPVPVFLASAKAVIGGTRTRSGAVGDFP